MSSTSRPADHPDRYTTVDEGPEVELRVKGSRFRGQVLPALDEREAAERLHAIRKRYHDATHHCWAQRVGPPEARQERSDDDGEPSGTAGTPLLQVLQRAEVEQALVVVTRWFGGTKLGTGGLVRAYGDAARLALEAAPRRVRWRLARLELRCGYEDVGAVEAVLARFGTRARGVRRQFEDEPRLVVTVVRADAAPLAAELVEATAGRVRVEIREEE